MQTMPMPDPEKFYQFEILSWDWFYVLSRLVRETKGVKEEDTSLLVMDNGTALFFMRKDKWPAEQIARVVGSAPEAIAKAKNIRLKPLAPNDPKMPRPTVNYYGEA